jgi:hypothetical protein
MNLGLRASTLGRVRGAPLITARYQESLDVSAYAQGLGITPSHLLGGGSAGVRMSVRDSHNTVRVGGTRACGT